MEGGFLIRAIPSRFLAGIFPRDEGAAEGRKMTAILS